MLSHPEKNWLAAYLYYAEPWEALLTEALQPFVQKIFERHLAEQFFFIRYWEKGSHIRLRFKGDDRLLTDEIKPELDDYFNTYFQKKPSLQEEPDWMKELPEEQRWYPNNSIQYIEYEPEVDRYGGPAGILIAERQFELSSRVILSVIKESEQWSYDRALGAAIQLHLGFAAALEMDLGETKAFYSHIFQGWFGRAYGYRPDMPTEEINKHQEITLKAFEENFKKQSPSLIPFHKMIWEALGQQVEFEQQWLNIWIRGMTKIGRELVNVRESEKLIIPEWFKPDKKIDVPEENQMLWSVLGSYVHMTNNRLGILNRDEAYLGYLIKRSLESL